MILMRGQVAAGGIGRCSISQRRCTAWRRTLPGGLAFSTSKQSLAQGVVVKQGAKKLKFAAKVSHGKLTITLKQPASSAQVTISSPAITVSSTLANKVKSGKVKTLPAVVASTNTRHATTRTTVKLRAS